MTRTISFLMPALLVLAACGDDGRVRPDASADTGMGDTATGDAMMDATVDATMDAAGDATMDAAGDATMDAAGDATMDAAGDATMDATADAMMDATADAMMDATADAMMDAVSDTPPASCVDLDLGGATGDAVAAEDLTGAVDDSMGSCGSTGGEDRAYSWTAPSTAEWTFDTFGSVADTVLHIHMGAECTAAELDCDDDTGGFQSRIDLMVTAGTLITIVVDAYNDTDSDLFQLNITETSTIAADEVGACTDGSDNDRDGDVDCDDSDCSAEAVCVETGAECVDGLDNDGDGATDCSDGDCDGYTGCIETLCTNTMDDDGDGAADCLDADCLTDPACETCPAVNLMMALGTSTGTTTGETNNRSGSCGGSSSEDRTHIFTAPAEGTYTIDTNGSTFDTVLYVLDGGCDGMELACDDDGGVSPQSEVIVDLGVGQSVIIVVDAFGGADGAYTLNISNAVMSFGAPAAAGDLVITEIMQNPDVITDTLGEWFEILNTTTSTLNLNGCTVTDLGTNSFTIGTDLVVAAGEYAVLARSSDPGFGPSFDWPGATALGNSDDEIIIACGAGPTEIDRVEYDGGPMFPDPTGASMSLSSSTTDHIMNDSGANWCEASLFLTPYDGDNRATPGRANPACP